MEKGRTSASPEVTKTVLMVLYVISWFTVERGGGRMWWGHGILNYKDTKAKCRHIKNWPLKGLCGRCLSEFMNSALRTVAPLTFCLAQHSHPHPLSQCQSALLNTDSVWLGGGGGCWDHPKQKARRGGGLRQINTCRKVPLQVNFLYDDILLWCLYS